MKSTYVPAARSARRQPNSARSSGGRGLGMRTAADHQALHRPEMAGDGGGEEAEEHEEEVEDRDR